jgi:hypothetical protein
MVCTARNRRDGRFGPRIGPFISISLSYQKRNVFPTSGCCDPASFHKSRSISLGSARSGITLLSLGFLHGWLLVQAGCEECRQYGSKKLSADREKAIVDGIRLQLGRLFVREVDGIAIGRWYEGLTGHRGLSASTAIRHFNVMHHMMEGLHALVEGNRH